MIVYTISVDIPAFIRYNEEDKRNNWDISRTRQSGGKTHGQRIYVYRNK